MTFAAHDLKYITLPVGWDAAYLSKYRMADGVTLDRVVADIEAALSMFNAERPWFWDFITYQNDPEVEYAQGNLVVEDHSEYTPPKGQRPDHTGHMLPVRKVDLGFRFTMDFLKEGKMSLVDGSIRKGIDAFRQWREYLIIKRALQRADDSGAAKGLGSTGLSPGFATAAANTGVDFTPDRYGGKTFDSNHEHFTSVAAASLQTALNAQIANLREHGHPTPYETWISESYVATIAALSGFVGPQPVTQIFGTDDPRTTRPPAASEVPYVLGSYGTNGGFDTWIRVVPRVTQHYLFTSKPYGNGDPRNPFRLRRDPRWGSGTMLIATNSNYPLDDAYLFEALGVGVGEDRTNGAALFIDNGATWADATVS